MVKAAAAKLSPGQVLDLKPLKEGEGLRSDEYLAASNMVSGMQEKSLNLSRERVATSKDMNPERAAELDTQIARLQSDIERLTGVLVPATTEAGRRLNALKIEAASNFDTAYWLLRARRSIGLPADVDLPSDIQKKVGDVLAKGREAQREAEARVLAAPRRAASPERETTQAQRRTAIALGVDREKLVEEAVQRRLAAIQAEAAGEVKTPGPRALTPEERLRVQSDPRVVAARSELIRQIHKLEKDGVLKTVILTVKAGLLTGLRTHEINLTSNAVKQAVTEIDRMPASLVDIGISMFTNQRTVQGANLPAVARASKAFFTKGVPQAKQVFREGATQADLIRGDIHRESNTDPEFLGKRLAFLGKRLAPLINVYNNTIFRSLAAEDRLFRASAQDRSISEQAWLIARNEARQKLISKDGIQAREQELRMQPTTEMQTKAIEYGAVETFNNKNLLASKLISEPKASLERSGDAGKLAAFAIDMTIPFTNTPANVFGNIIDHTPPGAAASAGFHIWQAVRKGMTPEQQRAISFAIGRGATGTAIIYAGAMAYKNGIATPGWQANPAQRATEEAAKRPPGSALIDGRWHQLGRVAPFGTLFALGATLMHEGERPMKDVATRPDKVAKAATSVMLENPMVKGVKDIAEVVTGEGFDYFAQSKAGMFAPAWLDYIGAATDESRRETRPEEKGIMAVPEAMGKGIAAKIPGLRQTLPEKKDVFGRALEQEKLPIVYAGLGTKETAGAVERELLRNRVGVSKVLQAAQELPAVFRARRDVVGALLQEELRNLLDSSDYQDLPARGAAQDESRKLALEKAIGHARQRVSKVTSSKDYKEATAGEKIAMLRELTQ